ncbi:uncharacterized protein V1510DRAFT_128702 [Dipodascopsis tothii]|uniref:uncharacterized protein n=1 Tax=Dipodascopsis tothii TaxID=44089 RepID=UPI0034CE3D10
MVQSIISQNPPAPSAHGPHLPSISKMAGDPPPLGTNPTRLSQSSFGSTPSSISTSSFPLSYPSHFQPSQQQPQPSQQRSPQQQRPPEQAQLAQQGQQPASALHPHPHHHAPQQQGAPGSHAPYTHPHQPHAQHPPHAQHAHPHSHPPQTHHAAPSPHQHPPQHPHPSHLSYSSSQSSPAASLRQEYYRNPTEPSHPPAMANTAAQHSLGMNQSSQISPQQSQRFNVHAWYDQASAPSGREYSNPSHPRQEPVDHLHNVSPRGSVASIGSMDSMQYTVSQRPPSPTSTPRVAPPILSYPYAPHPNAPTPTKGFPYAFPDPGIISSGQQHQPAYTAQRQMPPQQAAQGQGMYYVPNSSQPSMGYGHNPSRTSVDSYDRMSSRSMDMDADSTGIGPYSRSPELRQTHKIAERKRRRDMSLLYDDLKKILPDDKSLKTSKHEVLVRTIAMIKDLQKSNQIMAEQLSELKLKGPMDGLDDQRSKEHDPDMGHLN